MKTFKQYLNEATGKEIDLTKLKVGKEYIFIDEIDQTFKAKVLSIDPIKDGKDKGKYDVHYSYLDNSYSKKGNKDRFIVDKGEKVFREI